GMRVILCSPNISRTPRTGMPQSWLATISVTNARSSSSSAADGRSSTSVVIVVLSSLRSRDGITCRVVLCCDLLGQTLVQTGDQCVTLELGDIVGEPGVASGLDVRRVG